jgi:hypothetical protein
MIDRTAPAVAGDLVKAVCPDAEAFRATCVNSSDIAVEKAAGPGRLRPRP